MFKKIIGAAMVSMVAVHALAFEVDCPTAEETARAEAHGFTCAPSKAESDAHAEKQAELEAAVAAKKPTSMSSCLSLLEKKCSLVVTPYGDAKCEILNNKAGKEDVVVLYSTGYDVVSAFPILATNQKCGQLQMHTPGLASVAKFGEKLAFIVNKRLFEIHNTTTPSGDTGRLFVSEIKNSKKESYKSLLKVEESPYEDKLTIVSNNGQVITLDIDQLKEDKRISSVGGVSVKANAKTNADLEVQGK